MQKNALAFRTGTGILIRTRFVGPTKEISIRMRLFLCSVLFLSAPLWADTVYTYTGHPFTNDITAPYTTSSYVRGSFTVASPLTPNTTYTTLPFTSYIFTDGIDTFSNSFFHDADANVSGPTGPLDAPVMEVQTDASGNISHWYFRFASPGSLWNVDDYLITMDGLGFLPEDIAGRFLGNAGDVSWDPGTWTVSTPPVIRPLPPWDSQIIANLPPDFVPLDLLVGSAPVPEPQSLVLLTTGVLGGLVSLRRRIRV